MFVVDSGACTVTSTATCFRSPNYPAHYDIVIDTDYDYMGYNDIDIDINQACTITAHEAVMLSVTAFSTESGYDRLTVNGVQYSGTSGPNGVQVAAGSTITFTSDGSVTSSGFEICGTGAFPPNVSQPGRGVSLRGAPAHGADRLVLHCASAAAVAAEHHRESQHLSILHRVSVHLHQCVRAPSPCPPACVSPSCSRTR
jgi:hypothetical protein